jgi:hypothetical protein
MRKTTASSIPSFYPFDLCLFRKDEIRLPRLMIPSSCPYRIVMFIITDFSCYNNDTVGFLRPVSVPWLQVTPWPGCCSLPDRAGNGLYEEGIRSVGT